MIRVQDSLVTEEQIKKQVVLKSLNSTNSTNSKTSSNELLSGYYANQFANIDKSDRNLLEILELENSESSTMHNKLMIRDLRKKGHKRAAEDILAREEEAIRSKLKIKKPVLKLNSHIEQCTDPLFFVDDKGQVDLTQCFEVEKGATFQIFNDHKHIEEIDKEENYDNKDSTCKKIAKSYKQEAIGKKKEGKEEIVFDEDDKKSSCPVWMKISEKDEVKKDVILKNKKRFDDAKECIKYTKPYRKYKTSPWEIEKNGKGQDEGKSPFDSDYKKNNPGFGEGRKYRESFDCGQEKGLWKVEGSDRPRRSYDKKYYGEKTENDLEKAYERENWINNNRNRGENTFDNEKGYRQKTEKLKSNNQSINENYGTNRKDWRNTAKSWNERQNFEKQNAWDEQLRLQYHQGFDWNSDGKAEKKSSNASFLSKNNETQKIDSPELDAWGYQKLTPSVENCCHSNSTSSNYQAKWANPQSNNTTRNYNEKQYYRDRNSSNFRLNNFSISPKPDTEKENNIKSNEWTPRLKDSKPRPHQPNPDNISTTEAVDKKPWGMQYKGKDCSPSPFSSNNSHNTPCREHNNQKPSWDNSRYRKDQPTIKYGNPWNQARNDSGQQVCNGAKEISKEQHIWEPCYKKTYSDYNQTKRPGKNTLYDDSNNEIQGSCEYPRLKKVAFSTEKLEKNYEFNDNKNASEQPKSILLNKNTSPTIYPFSNSLSNLSSNKTINATTSDLTNLLQNHSETLSNPLEKNIPAYSSSYAKLFSDVLIKPEILKNNEKIDIMMCQHQYSLECSPVVIRKNANKKRENKHEMVLNEKLCNKRLFKLEAQYSLGCCAVDDKQNDSKNKKNPYEPAIKKDKEFGKNEERFNEIIKRVSDGKIEQKMSFSSSNIITKENINHALLTNQPPNMLPHHSETIFEDKFQQKSLKILNKLNPQPSKINIILDEVPFKEKPESYHKDLDYNKKQKFVDFTNTLNSKLQEFSPLKYVNTHTNFIQEPLVNEPSKFENCKKITRQKKILQYFPKNPTGSEAFFPSDLQKKANFSMISSKSLIKNTLSRSPLKSTKIANDIYPITTFFESLTPSKKTFGAYDKNTAPYFANDCDLEKKSPCKSSLLHIDNDSSPLREIYIEKLPCKRQGQEINFYNVPVKKTCSHDKSYKKLDMDEHSKHQSGKLRFNKAYCQNEGDVENWTTSWQAWEQNKLKTEAKTGPCEKQHML